MTTPLETPAAQTDDTGSTWVASKTYMQKLAPSGALTVTKAGMVRWRVAAATDTSFYVCPAIDVT